MNTVISALVLTPPHLTFVEFFPAFLRSRTVLAGRHVALQRTVPGKPFVAIWTFERFLTYTQQRNAVLCKACWD